MFRRAVGSLVARRFSPRATPRTAPARSLHSLRDIPIGEVLDGAAIFTAAALTGAGGTLAVHYLKKDPSVDDTGARKMIGDSKKATDKEVITEEVKKLDMNERFEQWIKKHNKKYHDDEEKAMRFKLFKATVEFIESHPPSVQKRCFPEISFAADFTEQERRRMLAYPREEDGMWKLERNKALLAKYEKGESMVWRTAMKQEKPAVEQGMPAVLAVEQGKPAVEQDDMRAKVSA